MLTDIEIRNVKPGDRPIKILDGGGHIHGGGPRWWPATVASKHAGS